MHSSQLNRICFVMIPVGFRRIESLRFPAYASAGRPPGRKGRTCRWARYPAPGTGAFPLGCFSDGSPYTAVPLRPGTWPLLACFAAKIRSAGPLGRISETPSIRPLTRYCLSSRVCQSSYLIRSLPGTFFIRYGAIANSRSVGMSLALNTVRPESFGLCPSAKSPGLGVQEECS